MGGFLFDRNSNEYKLTRGILLSTTMVILRQTIVNKSTLRVQDYWVFWTFPSSGILETRKHDVSEIGSLSVLK
jgi:ABC-type enterochelin transport system ATPase subunit